MKKGLIGKIIISIILAIFSMGFSYVITSNLDKHLFMPIDLLITFEDTKEFTLETTKSLEKEEALTFYPYAFKIENRGTEANYQILLEDVEIKNITRDNLNYVLMKDKKEVKSGSLKNLDNNVLYETKILEEDITLYQLYIYVTKESDDVIYTYQIKVVSN